MKINFYVLFVIVFFVVIGIWYGITLDEPTNTEKSQLPIHISAEDFENGIAFTDLNTIDGVSQEEVIIVDGILKYDE